MARQINFFLHPDDYFDFDIFLKSFGPILFIPELHYNNTITLVADSIRKGIEGEANRVYLVTPNYYTNFELKKYKQHNIWLINDNNLNVMHFDRCHFRHDSQGHFLYPGRLYFEPTYLKNGKLVTKPEEFRKWAEKIINATRRRLFQYEIPIKDKMGHIEKMEKWYLGENALSWAKEYNAEFRIGSVGLYSSTN